MSDPTEPIRRAMVKEINEKASEREQLESRVGQVWDTRELQEEFDVKSFLAPFVSVKRKSDGVEGTLTFQHQPRFYYGWQENDG